MTVALAILSPTSESYCVFIVVSAIGSVRCKSSVVMMSGHVKLFHAPTKVKIAIVSIADFTSGKITTCKIFHREAPSICADSTNSTGIPIIAFRIMNTPNAVGRGRINALNVFTHPSPRTRR